jgi:hypothetical protein
MGLGWAPAVNLPGLCRIFPEAPDSCASFNFKPTATISFLPFLPLASKKARNTQERERRAAILLISANRSYFLSDRM